MCVVEPILSILLVLLGSVCGDATLCVIPGLTAVFVVGLGRSAEDSDDDDEPEISSEDEQRHNNSDVELSD